MKMLSTMKVMSFAAVVIFASSLVACDDSKSSKSAKVTVKMEAIK